MGGAHLHTNRVIHISTPVTLEGNFSLWPGENDSIGTENGTSPAGDATILPDDHEICFFIPHQSPSQAGIQARRFKAVAAL